MTKAEHTAEELALAARRGSAHAFGELVERFQEPLFSFLRVRLGNAQDAEELAQEAFLRAWRRIDAYDPAWHFRTWLFALARNLAVSHHRAARPRATSDADVDDVEDAERPAGGDPAVDLADTEERSALWQLAARVLTEEQHTALWLRYAEDLPPLEIARVLDRRPSTVRVLLFRARERLASRLDRPAADSEPVTSDLKVAGDA